MSTITPTSALRVAYDAALAKGDLRPDSAQEAAVAVLENFAAQIQGHNPSKPGFLSHLGLKKHNAQPVKTGLYLYGDVGRGKSMLMDMFFNTSTITKKRRVHFHQFMLEIHERLHKLQGQADDILPELAKELASETWLLCFDEFHVNNIADAMILGRLFIALFDEGVIIVLTSNWPPDQLYKNGLQRDRFLPFIDLIKERMIVHCLNGNVDHRYEQIKGMQTYFSPLNEESTRKLQGIFLQMTDEAEPESIALPVQGRTLNIVHAAKGVGFFNFDELCVGNLGAADYLAIAECLHTVILDDVPRMSVEQRDQTLRFMTLIDTLYEAHVKFFMASAVPIEKLSPPGEHAFAFERTISRLMEMQGEEYRQLPHLITAAV